MNECPHKAIPWKDDATCRARTAICGECGSTIDNPHFDKERRIQGEYAALQRELDKEFPKPKTRTCVRIFKVEKDVSDEVELKNQKANPFGFSTAEIYWNGKRIGQYFCGGFELDEGFIHTETIEPIPDSVTPEK